MESRHGEIPGEIHSYLEGLVVKDIARRFVPATEVVDLVGWMVERGYMKDGERIIKEVNAFL